MNVDSIEQIILQNTFTKTDYLKRLTYLREFLEQKFFAANPTSFADYLTSVHASHYDRESMDKWDESFFNLFTKDNLYLLINGLIEKMKGLQTLTLYLPVVLDDYQLDSLGKWFRQNLNPELIMDIRLNPDLISGCAYAWNGKYKDLSFKSFMSKKQDIISKILEAYAVEKL